MPSYPIIFHDKDRIKITISPINEYDHSINIEFILDFDLFHEIIGIEILNLKHIAGEHCLDQIEQVIDSSGQNLSSTYDPDSDSFYLQISDELSTEQQAVDGLLIINNIGNILGFKADLPS